MENDSVFHSRLSICNRILHFQFSMMKNEKTSRCGKVLAGIESILLTEKSNLRPPALDPKSGNWQSVTFADPRRVVRCAFAGGGVSYREELQAPGGIASVDHLLEFSADRMDPCPHARLGELVEASHDGLVAILVTRNGSRLLVGYSEEHRDERPLRVVRAAETVVLRSRDTAGALSVNYELGIV
jgi:hypothetical protein